jgi:hypothetical protein
MPKRRVPLGQLEIPVPHSPGAKAQLTDEDKAELYREEQGTEAYWRQRALYDEAHACKCDKGDKPGKFHRPGCPKRPMRGGLL